MTFDTAIEKIMTELTPSLPSESIETVQRYIQMMYTIGYEAGSRSRSNQKPVIQMDKWGNVIEEFESGSMAARKTKISLKCINRVCNGERNQTGGYHWKFKNQKS